VIALGTVGDETFWMRLAVLAAISVAMTIGVYGLVGGIVKLDDLGRALSQRSGRAARTIGNIVLTGAPFLMKFLSIAGTAAMFLVGGSLLVHGIPPLHHLSEPLGFPLSTGLDAITGIVAGGVAVGLFTVVQKLRRR
jgi:predicted DNA repair protein MutK